MDIANLFFTQVGGLEEKCKYLSICVGFLLTENSSLRDVLKIPLLEKAVYDYLQVLR